MSSKVDFQKASINRLLIRIGVPAFWGIAVSLIYGFIDGIFIGKGVGSHALSGVTIIFPVTFMITALSSLIGEGAASLVARSIAGGDKGKALKVIGNAVAACLWLGIGTSFLGFGFAQGIARFFGADSENIRYATDYLEVLSFGFPFFALSIIYYHILNAQGEMRSASKAIVTTTLLNILLDYVAIYRLKMGVAGAAYATVIAQMICSLWLYTFSVRTKHVLGVVVPKFGKGGFRQLKALSYLGMGSFVRQMGIVISLALINKVSSQYGNYLYVASFGAAIRVMRLFLSPIAAIGMAFKPIAGHSFGHHNYGRLAEAVKKASLQTMFQGTVLFILLIAFREPLGALFGIADGEGMAIFSRIMLIIAFSFPFIGLHHIATSYFVAIGKPRPSVVLNIMKQFLLLVPLVIILPRYFGVFAIYWAMPISDAINIVIAYIWLRSNLNRQPVLKSVI